MADIQGALAGLVVVERAGSIATAACASILASLGARVLRAELPDEARRLTALPFPERLLRSGGKERIQLAPETADFESDWQRLLGAADVLLFDPPAPAEPDSRFVQQQLVAGAGTKVVCAISPAGLHGNDLPSAASDPLVQAVSGLMAVTGEQGGRPEFVRVPVAALSAAIIAVTAILAALRVRNRDGVGQLIDLSLIEVMADQLRTHVPMVVAGTSRGFRIGCRHPVCSPWNVYRARDGWVLICSASDGQWQAILDVVGRVDAKTDPRFSSPALRRIHEDEVDAIVGGWVAAHDIAEVLTALTAIKIPAGPAQSIAQVIDDQLLRECGTVRTLHDDAGGAGYAAGSTLRLSRTPPRQAAAPAAVARGIPSDLPVRAQASRTKSQLQPPLAGVRVIELSRYAAGPLAGLVLASLGAEVIKVEQPGGEDCRMWAPRFGSSSGYFANYNAGKRSIVLDLREKAARASLAGLIATADIVLQNLRPGVLERMGFGADEVTALHPRLVYASISGFGLRGPEVAALDTVVQGRLGLTALTGDGQIPMRVGYSIADQLAGHHAAAGILAALAERDRSGLGQIVDIAMADAVAWLTQLAWTQLAPGVSVSHWETRDGWVVADGAPAAQVGNAIAASDMTRAELVRSLAARGIMAAPVLEADEVLAQPVIRNRASLHRIETRDGAATSIFAVPLGLTTTAVLRPARMRELGEDNAALLGDAVASV